MNNRELHCVRSFIIFQQVYSFQFDLKAEIKSQFYIQSNTPLIHRQLWVVVNFAAVRDWFYWGLYVILQKRLLTKHQ